MYIGLLSGTSLDGIDAALVQFENNVPNIIDVHNHPIPKWFKENCLSLTHKKYQNIEAIGELDYIAGHLFANAAIELLKKKNINKKYIKAIGSHGQTIIHKPKSACPFTLQIGDPNIISAKTEILTVADFRRSDMAVGGQGAPLAPAFHSAIFRSRSENRVIINIGGISNITILPAYSNLVIGFDTGPGNCLLNDWIFENKKLDYDIDGEYARQGEVIPILLQKMLEDKFINQTPPKSTGREYFNLTWLKQFDIKDYRPEDIQRTLLELTVITIIRNINTYDHGKKPSLYLCGGGAKNKFLKERMSEIYNDEIKTTNDLGIHVDWVEACLFAWLAKQRINNNASNLPSITGAKYSVSLGNIFHVVEQKTTINTTFA